MLIFEAKNDSSQPRVAIVGCLHGNETLGLDLFYEITKHPMKFSNLLFIIANTAAHKKDTRFIDQDLNRSFPGSSTGNNEEKLAAEIMRLTKDADVVIDIHTTTSPGFEAAAITGKLTPEKKHMIRAFGLTKVVIMKDDLLKASLIGNVKQGISIEYGLKTAQEKKLLIQLFHAVLAIQSQVGKQDATSLQADIYDVADVIPRSTDVKEALQNFVFSNDLQGYPFILDEKHYTDSRGFLLKNKRSQHI